MSGDNHELIRHVYPLRSPFVNLATYNNDSLAKLIVIGSLESSRLPRIVTGNGRNIADHAITLR